MDRRSSLCGLAVVPFAAMMASAGLAQGDPLADAFSFLSEAERRAVQQELLTGGFSGGAVDARFGPGTRTALVEAAAFIAENSGRRETPDVTTTVAAETYLRRLASGEVAAWLYGEGAEADHLALRALLLFKLLGEIGHAALHFFLKGLEFLLLATELL